MGSNELKIRIVFAFALTATLTPTACVCRLFTRPEGLKFVIPVGTHIDIICNETSDLIETISWRKANRDYLNERNIREQKVADNSVKLVFTNPTQDDSGKYYCMSKSRRSIYKGEEILIEMNFYDPELKFESSFENIFAEEGSTLEVKCSAIGEKHIRYEWRNQYQEVISRSFQIRSEPIFISQSGNGSVLKIPKMSSNITGSYTCKASNKYGMAKKEYEILIRSATDADKNNSIPIVRHVQVVNLTSNSVQFAISVSGAANSIRMRYSENFIVHERVWKRGDAYEVKDLVPGNSYKFIFKAIPRDNIFSDSDDKGWSKEHVVVMLPVKPDVIFHEHVGGSVQIGWNRNKGTSKVDKYKLTYFPIKIDQHTQDWTKNNCPITVEIPFCSNVNYTISGLSPHMYYELQLQGHTAGGYGEAYKQRIYVK